MTETRVSTKDPNHTKASNAKLNSLRAAVLGANDGVVSVSSIILGVVGATDSRSTILAAGIAGLAAGALSMAAGEYVSVSSQRDTEQALIATEKWRLRHHPEEEFEDLATTFEEKGLRSETARQVAKELTAHDALRAHLDAEFGIDEENLSSPWLASFASLVAFTIGGIVPLLAVLFAHAHIRVLVTVAAASVALAASGYASALVSRSPRIRVIARALFGGIFAMAITFSVGRVFGHFIG